ncbi:MAG: hypothetical protein V1838_02415 [Patescibacteria group bacterium]
MNILRRLTPLLSTLIIILLLEWLLGNAFFIWGVAIMLVLVSITATVLLNRGETRGGRWHFTLLAGSYVISVILFLTFLENNAIKHSHIISAGILWWLWVEQMYRFQYDTNSYVPFSVANVTSLLTLMASFYSITAAFAFKLLLNYPIWQLTLAVAIVAFVLSIETIWSEKLSPLRYWATPTIIGLVTAELFWVTSYLPTSYLVNGIVITIIFYVIVNLSRFFIKKELTKAIITRYLLVSLFMLILTIASARWI